MVPESSEMARFGMLAKVRYARGMKIALKRKKVLFLITKSNWDNATWKPTVFQRSLVTSLTAFLHGKQLVFRPLPPRRPFANIIL
jgi:hypothetical protein